MDDKLLKETAAQLRKPHGENATLIVEKMNEGNRALYQNTFEALDIKDNYTVLEIGMANGFYVEQILEKAKNINYHGCDYSKEMVEQSQLLNKASVSSGKSKFHLACADSLPFSENKFDLIFSINTIYFWDDTKKILSELHRVLKPSSKLVLSLRPEKSMKDYPFAKFGFELYSKEKIEKILEQNNYKVTSIIEKEESSYKVEEMELKVESLIVVAEKI